jgi:putative alpha-1,2-mannosidase
MGISIEEALTTSPGAKFTPLAFDRRDEQAHPGYYAVTLTSGVQVELTVAERTGIARFAFPEGGDMRMLINAGSSANSIPGTNENPRDHEAFGNHIEVKPDGSFSGWIRAGRFCGSDSHYKLFDRATLRFAGGRTMVISREGLGIYVQEVMLNRILYPNSWLQISQIHPGTNQLRFKMGAEPNMQRGTAPEDRPPGVPIITSPACFR